MSCETESDWENDPGLENPKLFNNSSNPKNFRKPTISSLMKKQLTDSPGVQLLNTSNSANLSPSKSSKPNGIKDVHQKNELTDNKKQIQTKNRHTKWNGNPKGEKENLEPQKPKTHNVRFAKLSEVSKTNGEKRNPPKRESCSKNVINLKRTKSLLRHIKVDQKCDDSRSRIKSGVGETIAKKSNVSLPQFKKKIAKNEKHFTSSKRKWISSDKNKVFDKKNVDSSDQDASCNASEKERFSEISSKYELSSGSKYNLRSNDPSDVSRLKAKDSANCNNPVINPKHQKKTEPPFRKMFLRKSDVKRQPIDAMEEDVKCPSEIHNTKVVEEWLSNHYLPLSQTSVQSSQVKNKTCKNLSSPRSRNGLQKSSEKSFKIAQLSENEKQDENESDSLAETVKNGEDNEAFQITNQVNVNAAPTSGEEKDCSQTVSPRNAELIIRNDEEKDNYQSVDKNDKDVLERKSPDGLISTADDTQISCKSPPTKNSPQGNGVFGDLKTADDAQLSDSETVKTLEINDKRASDSAKFEEDQNIQLDKKVTFSEVKIKVQPLGVQNSTMVNRDRLLKDVSADVEDFQNKNITFSVVEISSEDKTKCKSREIPRNLSEISMKETDVSNSLSFIKKFNEVIEQSYMTKENDAKFATPKRRENPVYDPEMLKCSPTSSQWSYAVDLVNSVLKSSMKPENDPLPFYASSSCARDCMLSQFHTNRIKFSLIPRGENALNDSRIDLETGNEFSIWKNNNNVNNDNKKNTSWYCASTLSPEKNLDPYCAREPRQFESHPYQTHSWPGKCRNYSHEENYETLQDVETCANYCNANFYNGFSQSSGPLFPGHGVMEGYTDQNSHSIYPLSFRYIDNVMECPPDFSDFYVDHCVSKDSSMDMWTTILPVDQKFVNNPHFNGTFMEAQSFQKWDQAPNKHLDPNEVRSVQNWIQNSFVKYKPNEMRKVQEEENVEKFNPYHKNANNFTIDQNSTIIEEKSREKHSKDGQHRIRFCVTGGTMPFHYMKHLDVPREANFGEESWSSNMDPYDEIHRNKTYNRLKIEQASDSSSFSSISHSNNRKEIKCGLLNLESNIIGTVPSRSNQNIEPTPISTKPVSSSITFSTVKSDGSQCSSSSNVRRRSHHRFSRNIQTCSKLKTRDRHPAVYNSSRFKMINS